MDSENLQSQIQTNTISTCPSSQPTLVSSQEASNISSLKSTPNSDGTSRIISLPFKTPIFTIIRDAKPSMDSQNSQKPLSHYNRKEKSLGELSKKFLMMFGRINDCLISLDTVTRQLGVERRRIYDIINILESLGVVYRKGKNNYQWRGLRSIHHTISKLKTESALRKGEDPIIGDDDDSDDDDEFNNRPAKKEKSLGLLSTGFIRLFFSWKDVISLEQAARRLSSETIEDNKIKTKIRRLYDIANVFSSLGLIKKTSLDTKKPAFQWIGAPGLDKFIERLHACQDEKDIFLDKFSLKEGGLHEHMKLARSKSSQTIQSQGSAFKQRDTPQPGISVLEGLLCMILEVCKKGMGNGENKERVLSQDAALLTRAVSEESGAKDFVTPNIKKSVSILQKIGTEDITPEKMSERSVLKDRTNEPLMLKRSLSDKLDDFSSRNVKKIQTIKNSVLFSDQSLIKPFEGPIKENSSDIKLEIKVEQNTQQLKMGPE